jgi:hypothetical protein
MPKPKPYCFTHDVATASVAYLVFLVCIEHDDELVSADGHAGRGESVMNKGLQASLASLV